MLSSPFLSIRTAEMIKPFLRESIDRFRNDADSKGRRFTVLDVGCYCGYSAIFMAATIKEFAPNLDFHVISTEINPKHIGVANTLIQIAKLEEHITVVQTGSAETALAEHVGSKQAVAFVFFDHAKDQYLTDLRVLENAGHIRKNTRVVADNVVVSEALASYREYVEDLADKGVTATKLEYTRLEYTENLTDGLGKFN